VTTRPFRTLHHPIADVGVIGGGQMAIPGEVSLAHHGQRPIDRTSAANQSRQIMPDRSRALSGLTVAGALAPDREYRQLTQNDSCFPDSSRID
jgi:hypothetical protein